MTSDEHPAAQLGIDGVVVEAGEVWTPMGGGSGESEQ